MVLLAAVGFVFFIARNQVAYGNWFGSFSADYAGDTARPQVPLFSAYINLWSWAIQITSIVCLWQFTAGRAGRLVLFCPVVIGGLFAIVEGNRGLITTVVLMYLGWLGLRTRLTGRRIAAGLLTLTLLTLMANARYHKGETSFSERVSNVFEPEYFRPFWSSDPVGPALVSTYECWRSTQDGVAFGRTYLRNLVAMTPSAIWPGRPEDAGTVFAKWYETREGLSWAPGTGYAFNSIAEACMDFWYFGPALLGLVCGRLASRLTRWSTMRSDLAGRAVFASCVALAILPMVRGSLMTFVSPILLVNYWLIAYAVRVCSVHGAVVLPQPAPARAALCAREL